MKPKPCPICGKEVKVLTLGTDIKIECCVTMSRVKSDYFKHYDDPDYLEWNDEKNRYQDEAENHALSEFLKEWNTRGGSRDVKTNARPLSFTPTEDDKETAEIRFSVQHEVFRDEQAFTLEQELIIKKSWSFGTEYEINMPITDFGYGSDLPKMIDGYADWFRRMSIALKEENNKGSFESIKI